MAGDISNFVYTDDFGNRYRVRLDATNARAMGFPDAASGENLPPLPSRFRMRTANFIQPSNNIKRTLPAPIKDSPKIKSGTTINLPVYGVSTQTNLAFIIQGRKGEKQTYT